MEREGTGGREGVRDIAGRGCWRQGERVGVASQPGPMEGFEFHRASPRYSRRSRRRVIIAQIGTLQKVSNTSDGSNFVGYLAHFHNIDGTQYAATDFGDSDILNAFKVAFNIL